MDRLLTVAVIGCGSRGLDTYGQMMKEHLQDKVRVVAATDLRPDRLEGMKKLWGLADDQCYASAEELLSQPKLADMAVIATQDHDHYGHAKAALEKGYHLLLEKPIAPYAEECRELAQLAEARQLHVAVCHVLRYTPFYQKIKEIIDSGEIGDLVSLQGIEQVCYWHQAHSFVRGNWRNKAESAPMILAKCCHDMDILLWLTGKKCLRVSSMGSLKHFRADQAPEGAAARCVDCPVKDCPYNAVDFYLDRLRESGDDWPQNVVVMHPTEERLMAALKDGPYGRCVYHCDNDVVDHQVVTMLLEGDVTVSYTMCAFTAHGGRCLRVMGSRGEILADMKANTIRLMRFGQEDEVIDVRKLADDFSGHGGGDARLVREYVDFLRGECGMTGTMTSIGRSVESHLVALAAEESRLKGGMPIELA